MVLQSPRGRVLEARRATSGSPKCTTAKTAKQPKCPATEERAKKRWRIIRWGAAQLQKRMKCCHLQPRGWTYRFSYEAKYVRKGTTSTI